MLRGGILMKKCLIVFMVMFSILVVGSYAAADNGPEVIVIEKVKEKFAPVTFKHLEHQKKENVTCATCHHKSKEGETPKACSSCHGVVEGAASFKDAMHKKCKACHKTESAAGKSAPTKCTGCHVK
jgi:hypothetical protein